MDNVIMGWDRPQEDEFALVNLGLPSPYHNMAFPNHGPACPEYLGLDGLDESKLSAWKDGLVWFLKRVYYRTPRRIILKSPTHTARVGILAELFPGARFIHLVRDPMSLFPSTVRLWKSMYETQALQLATNARLEEYVFDTFHRMYQSFERQRTTLAPNQICDVKYEELTRDPLAVMESLYQGLDLGDFEPARAKVQEYVSRNANYQRNRHRLDRSLEEEIILRWRPYFLKYGYPTDCRHSLDEAIA
jgi:hypothetical protein